MKKILPLLIWILLSTQLFSQTARQVPSGRWYWENFIDSTRITIVYLHGSGQMGGTQSDLNKIKQVAFYTKFYAANADEYNIFMPQQYTGFSGWENIVGGVTSGADFVRFIKSHYHVDKVVVTGHSAGAT